jgi:hypothetical protein
MVVPKTATRAAINAFDSSMCGTNVALARLTC